jgi:hypothetical protein
MALSSRVVSTRARGPRAAPVRAILNRPPGDCVAYASERAGVQRVSPDALHRTAVYQIGQRATEARMVRCEPSPSSSLKS